MPLLSLGFRATSLGIGEVEHHQNAQDSSGMGTQVAGGVQPGTAQRGEKS